MIKRGPEQPFTVVTCNTQYANAISSDTVGVFDGTDVLLLQEVLGIESLQAAKNLGSIGLTVAAYNKDAGLTIAVSRRFSYFNQRYHLLQPKNRLAEPLEKLGMKPRFRERGLLTVGLTDLHGNRLTVATAHPIVCVRALSRARQVRAGSRVLTSVYPTGALVLGADMNHYPGPQAVDKQLAASSGLTPVSSEEPTCYLADTHHSWLQHLHLPDGLLDTMLYRGLTEQASENLKVTSDHQAKSAQFEF